MRRTSNLNKAWDRAGRRPAPALVMREERKTGNLIVKNSAGQVPIDEIEVIKIGQTVKKLTSQSIANGYSSDSIPLEPGVYDVAVTFKDLNGNTHVVREQVMINQEGDTVFEIFQAPQEPKVLIKANLVYSSGKNR